jgi:hypothetical protein
MPLRHRVKRYCTAPAFDNRVRSQSCPLARFCRRTHTRRLNPFATLLYASKTSHPKLTVFAASAAALVLTSALGVAVGSVIAEHANPKLVRWVAGLGFLAVGAWVLLAGEA